MKKLFYFLMTTCMVYLYSCGGDDDNPDPDTEDPTFEVKYKIGINGTLKPIGQQDVNLYASSGDTVYLSGTFEDNIGLKSIRLEVTNSSETSIVDQTFNSFDNSKMGSYNVFLPIPSNFLQGTYNVKITATDHGNNSVSVEGNLFIDNAGPSLMLNAKVGTNGTSMPITQDLIINVSRGETIHISGTIEDNIGLKSIVLDITSSGISIPPAPYTDDEFTDPKVHMYNFSYPIPAITPPGTYKANIKANDLSNNSTSIDINIKVN